MGNPKLVTVFKEVKQMIFLFVLFTKEKCLDIIQKVVCVEEEGFSYKEVEGENSLE